jgi:hypothetical protein
MLVVTKSIVVFLAIAGTNWAAGAGQAESKRAPRDVEADTDPGSAFWRGAPAIFLENDRNGKPVPGYKSEIRSRWTPQNLYFLFVCPYEELNLKPNPNISAETNQLWNWDVAETFIGSDPEHIRRYKEFEISPEGEWVDLDINLDAPRHEDGWTWNSGIKVAARIDRDAKVWYGVMQIPYASIDNRRAAEGNVLRINFFRSQGPQATRKALTWQPTNRTTFHVPEAFGTIKLVN